MTVSNERQDVSATGGDSRHVLSGWLCIVGGIVILATAVVLTVAALWLFAPELLTGSRRAEGMIIRILVTSLIVSSGGGLFMSLMTRNPSWLLTLLAAGGMVTLWLLIGAAMGPLMH